MEVYDQLVVQKARRLRRLGLSFKKIGQKFLISERTIRAWCLDIPNQNHDFLAAQNNRKEIKESERYIFNNMVLDKNLAKVFVSLLYWAEGTKYPHSTAISFSNSDPDMVLTFVKLLRYAFSLDEKKFKVHLQLHTTHNKRKAFTYWSKLLEIPIKQFWKPTITTPTHKMKRRNYYGTCTIRYHDYKILLKLIGVYENFAERSHRGLLQRVANPPAV